MGQHTFSRHFSHNYDILGSRDTMCKIATSCDRNCAVWNLKITIVITIIETCWNILKQPCDSTFNCFNCTHGYLHVPLRKWPEKTVKFKLEPATWLRGMTNSDCFICERMPPRISSQPKTLSLLNIPSTIFRILEPQRSVAHPLGRRTVQTKQVEPRSWPEQVALVQNGIWLTNWNCEDIWHLACL